MVNQRIPGPVEWPWVGSVQSLVENPPGFLLGLAQTYGFMARFTLFGLPIVLVSDPAVIREVLVERVDEFPKSPRDLALLSPYLGHGLLINNGSSHRQRRRLVQPAFHHKRIQSYADIMVGYTEDMVARWQDGQILSVNEEMMHLTLYIVAKSLFKEDAAQMARLAGIIGHAVRELQEVIDEDLGKPWIAPLWWPTPGGKRRRTLQKTLRTTIDDIITHRMATTTGDAIEDRGDLVSMLLLSKDEAGNGLSHEEVRDEAVTILLAGHETTSNALTWTFYLLGRHPEAAAKLYTEVDSVLAGRAPTLADLPNLPYTAQVVKEAMRLYPPAWILNARRVTADTTLGGYTVSKGTDLFISPYVMHRQPEYFDQADAFVPERFTAEFEDALPRFAYMPFGGGPRVCIGNSFAMMEAQLILATVSSKFALAALNGKPAELNPQITLSIKDGLKMRAIARASNGEIRGQKVEAGELLTTG